MTPVLRDAPRVNPESMSSPNRMQVHTAQRMPTNPGPAGWRELLMPHELHEWPALDADIQADAVIVGAGFAGLFVAHRLSALRPDWRIVVLEAHRIADGPSGRNSGFMIDLPHALNSDSYHGQADADRLQIVMNRRAIDYAAACASEFDIGRDAFDPCGKINAAATEAGMAKNHGYSQWLQSIGEPHRLLDAVEMRATTGSTHYVGGLFTPGTVMLQPARFVQALASGLTPAVELHEHSGVIALRREGASWQVQTVRASVAAPVAVLAVNGHAESFGFYRHRLMHVFTYASMTRALSDAQARALGGETRWSLTSADPMGTTVRRIESAQGTRIVVRNRSTFAPGMVPSEREFAAAKADHRRSFDARFPMLDDVQMEYAWGGHLCLSANEVNAFGRIDEGLYSACCQNGLGTVQGTLSGILAAELICDVDSPALRHRLAQLPPRWMPPGPWTTWAANRIIGRRERRGGAEK